MKSTIQRILQQILGYKTYLWYFTLFKIKTLKFSSDEDEFFVFLKSIKKDFTVLDIGANLGLMSYFLAKKSKKVFAFEPMPNNYWILQRLVKRFKLINVQLLNCALGKENSTLTMVLPEVDGVKKQGLSHVIDEKITEFNDGSKLQVECYKLDDLKEIQGHKIDAIKIDVENFEYEVFEGAQELLKRDKPIIYCELWNNQNRLDCFELLKNLGYERFWFDGNKLELLQANNPDVLNFFFIPKTS